MRDYRELKVWQKAAEYEGLATEVAAVMRMLTSFIQKLKANG